MIPEEDRGPAWLRDYGYTDFGDIEADLAAMEDFAKKLASEVDDNYAPHVPSVTDAMVVALPQPAETFPELVSFMQAHQTAQDTTQKNVFNFAGGTQDFAAAAHKISKEYRGSDAFSRARVTDVDKAFGKTSADGMTSSDYPGGNA